MSLSLSLSLSHTHTHTILQAQTRLREQGDLFVYAASPPSSPAARLSPGTTRELVLRRDGMQASYGFRCTSRSQPGKPPRYVTDRMVRVRFTLITS